MEILINVKVLYSGKYYYESNGYSGYKKVPYYYLHNPKLIEQSYHDIHQPKKYTLSFGTYKQKLYEIFT